MRTARVDSPTHARQESWETVRRAISGVLTALRLTVYSILALLEPIIVWSAMAIALTGIALCVFFDIVVHAPHFPTGVVLALIAASGASLVGYYALMAFLLPD
jgi:hypothetical protein